MLNELIVPHLLGILFFYFHCEQSELLNLHTSFFLGGFNKMFPLGCLEMHLIGQWIRGSYWLVGRVAVVVIVESHNQRIVLATEETTVAQQVSHRPIKCQSRLWSQRGTKVNGSNHGDNPLLRPTGIQIVTKSYATAMGPTYIKTVHQNSLLHIIESNLDRLGLLSPTHHQRSQQQTGQIALQPVLHT